MSNSCKDCKHRSLTTQWRYLKLWEWRCTAPKYTSHEGGRPNYFTCSFVRNHDGYMHCTSHEEVT